MQFILRTIISALLIATSVEVARRSPRMGGLILSLPLTSIIALVWLYATGSDAEKVAALAWSTLWYVVPSLALFIALPALLRLGVPFVAGLSVAILLTASLYSIWPRLLASLGIKL